MSRPRLRLERGDDDQAPFAPSRPADLPTAAGRSWAHRIAALLTLVGLGAVIFAVGWWAGREALLPPADPLDVAAPITYEVVAGEIGRSLTFTAVAEWELQPLARSASAGTVTSVDVAAGESVTAGQVLFTVDLRPTVVAQGAVPAFRDLARNSSGADVAQLQALLAALGYFEGEADGTFGAGTRAAVRAWQDDLGIDDDGVVRRGDIVYVPSLPARVALGEAIEVGAPITGGEQAVWLLPDAPAFRIPLATEQRDLVPLTAAVRVVHADGAWEAETVRAVETADGALDLVLGPAAGSGSICGDQCSTGVALTGQSDFRAEVVVVPPTEGPVVPIAAITTSPAGQPQVTLANGELRPVEIVETADGLAVVTGLAVGDVVVIPAGATG